MSESSVRRLDLALKAHVPIDGIGPRILGIAVGPGNVRVDFLAHATPTQRAQAEDIVAAFDWSPAAQDAALAQAQRTDAKALYDALDRLGKLTRARDRVLLKEINMLRQWLLSFKTAVATAKNLQNLQARVAAMPALPDRKPSQIRAAILNELDFGEAAQPPA